MNLPKFSLDNSKIVYFFLAIMLLGGVWSFTKLGKKEDAPFVIKQVVMVTQYPGATPEEVSQLISEPIERELQTMVGVKVVRSESFFGLSKVTIELLPSTAAEIIPQRWDELRRKVLNIQPKLPSGASAIQVSDDFGDVFGIYFGLTAGEGFTYADMRHWAELVKRELVTVDGVQKVALYGVQTETVNLLISLPTLANLGVDPNSIVQIVSSQNKLVGTSVKQADEQNIVIYAAGTYANIQDIADQIISTKDGRQIRLGDIAKVEKGYLDPPSTLMRVNCLPAIGIGISTQSGRDVVQTGELVEKRLAEIKAQIPVGIDVVPLYMENQIAADANNGFIINLLESLVIVIFIIMLVMGLRAGVLIGSSLLFSIGGTMLLMLIMGVGLNRTSLAGFIIAMGMLVDNAIVVTDNAQVAMRRGEARRKALIDGAIQPQWGLLGATFIGVCSFLPLYLAPSSAAEIVKPLFIVLSLSLGLSWILALTQTPLFGNFLLKENKKGETKDPYDTKFYHWFSGVLRRLIRLRGLVIGVVIAMFFGALYLMGQAPQGFFPALEKPYFKADVFLPDGYSIQAGDKELQALSKHLLAIEGVKNVSMTVGGSPLRYYLASTSFGPKPNFGNLLVELESEEYTAKVEHDFYIYCKENYPNLLVRTALFMLSPAVEASIEIGFLGMNPDTLMMLSQRAEKIMSECTSVGDVRNDWGNKVPVLTPVYSQQKGQRLGVTRSAVAQYTSLSTTGIPMGEYRQGDIFMPIMLKDASADVFNLANFGSQPIFTPSGRVVSLDQVTDSICERYMYSVVKRYQRQMVVRAQCDPLLGANTAAAFQEIAARVKAEIEPNLPEGYSIKVFGDQESQDESNAALAENMPLTMILIFVTLLLLFRTYRKPVVILLMIPLIFIGVVLGLAISGKTLDFFAILGVLGLVGMNIKNAVVLVDQIHIEKNKGLPYIDAVISATRSRIVPVVMASGTTILGMLPLLPDALFGGMAAVIMGGLLVATFLTIVVLPVTFCLIMRIKS
ncbi:MAG: efflux RND transporter permease subunit [Mucinivorans sp.]